MWFNLSDDPATTHHRLLIITSAITDPTTFLIPTFTDYQPRRTMTTTPLGNLVAAIFWLLHIIPFTRTPSLVLLGLILGLNAVSNTLQTVFEPDSVPFLTSTDILATNNFAIITFILYHLSTQSELIWVHGGMYLVRTIAVVYYTTRHEYLQLLILGLMLFSPLSPIHRTVHSLFLPDSVRWSFLNRSTSGGDRGDGSDNDDDGETVSQANKNGIFDLSHALINIDPYTNLYGNLGLWGPLDYPSLLSAEANNQSLPKLPPLSQPEARKEAIVRYQQQGDLIEQYLASLQKAAWCSVSPSSDTKSCYFIAARRFALLVYQHAGVLPPRLLERAFDHKQTRLMDGRKSSKPTNQTTIPRQLLDVGIGCGDQLFTLIDLWENREPQAAAIAITGVNYSQVQTRTASDRFHQRYPHLVLDPAGPAHAHPSTSQIGTKSSITSATFINGSATELISTIGLRDGSYDAITAIDAIYHFAPKVDFLRDSFTLLKSTGLFVCTDLIIKPDLSCDICQGYISGSMRSDDGARARPALQTVLTNCLPRGHLAWLLPHFSEMFSIPSVNLWTQERYKNELELIGFERVHFVHLDSLIFNHFGSFLDELVASFPPKLIAPAQWFKFMMTSHALKHWAPHLFRYTLIIAEKKVPA